MKEILIDLSDIQTRDEIHYELQTKLNLPDYYGRNLDALYDSLSTLFIGQNILITLKGFTKLPSDIQNYGRIVISIFNKVAEEMSLLPDNSLMTINILD